MRAFIDKSGLASCRTRKDPTEIPPPPQITGFPANVSNRQGGNSTHFSAGKCHLLYFVVVPESLKIKINSGETSLKLQMILSLVVVECVLRQQGS